MVYMPKKCLSSNHSYTDTNCLFDLSRLPRLLRQFILGIERLLDNLSSIVVRCDPAGAYMSQSLLVLGRQGVSAGASLRMLNSRAK